MRLRLLVTGKQGQVVASMLERAPPDIEIVALGRPELDLADPAAITCAFDNQTVDVVVNAAAYTGVDKAEAEESLATRINGEGAGLVAAAARRLGAPVIHLSTDYVFDGQDHRPYREDDPTGPIGAYGRSKLAGEVAVAEANPRHAILRTAWVYSPFGANFVKTMLRLGKTRDELSVVSDQRGAPTSALDIADAVFEVARGIVGDVAPRKFGVFHMTGAGEASWAEFAAAIFHEAQRHGRASVRILPILTREYPTPARRPANSRLDTARLARDYGIRLPSWRDSLKPVVARLLADEAT